MKRDVAKDLPDKVETTITAVMNNDQRKIYEAELQRAKGLIEKGDNKIVILSAITRLRQICVDPSLYIENYSGTSSKLELLMETIENKRVNKQKSIEEQNKTASQAKQIRIAQIEPLEKTVNQFIAECIN